VTTCEPQSQRSELQSRNTLLKKWLLALALNAGVKLDDVDAIGVTLTLWTEGFADLSDSVLEAAFRKTLKAAKFWPVKVADVREYVTRAIQNETDDAAERAWQTVLDVRRVHWCPDVPGPFDRALARLTERVRQAARAAGIWRDFTASEYENGALHTWGKKRFIESFNAWGEQEQDKFLLPDGEAKKLLIELAETKALPGTKPKEAPQLPAEERLRIADQLAEAARQVIAQDEDAKKYTVNVSDGAREAFRKQAERIKALYPESKTTDPVLLQFISPAAGKATTS
jgi:hypothetical protein